MPVPLPTRQSLGRVVREHRTERGLAIEGLADLAGMHPTYLSDIELGKGNRSIGKLGDLASVFDVRVSDMIPGAEQS